MYASRGSLRKTQQPNLNFYQTINVLSTGKYQKYNEFCHQVKINICIIINFKNDLNCSVSVIELSCLEKADKKQIEYFEYPECSLLYK